MSHEAGPDFRATTGTVYAHLIDDTGATLSGSTISTAATVLTRVRSAVVLPLDGKSYRAQFGHAPGEAGAFIGARLVAVE